MTTVDAGHSSKHLTVSPNEAADRLSIRELVEAYLGAFAKIDGAWLFSERRLYVDWVDERPLS